MNPTLKELQHFPFKLYVMVEHATDSDDCNHVVSWIKDGRAFAIYDRDLFLKHIVPRFFKQTKFRSFTRQLNLWGFTRCVCNEGPVDGAWKHEHFVRGRVENLGFIQRVEVKSSKPKISKPRTRAANEVTMERVVSLAACNNDNIISSVAMSTAVSPMFDSGSVPTMHIPKNASVTQPLVLNSESRSIIQPLVCNMPFQGKAVHSEFQPTFQAETNAVSLFHPSFSATQPTATMNASQFHSQNSPATVQSSFDSCSSLLNIQCQQLLSRRNYVDHNNNIHHQKDNTLAGDSANGDDILFELSSIFELDETRPHEDDKSLSSIMSNDVCDDFMNPLSF
mmetsp:Transcript_39227/g.84604  ORF Transcript_39227/g.84604 Transcript_39227/m.84604 type:complete len:337 (-) Transcript_39227:112-1122(-)